MNSVDKIKKNENPLISVIVPIFNMGKYLEQCLRSIATQTYANLEILCIDDGSTDNSLDICNEFSSIDPRFQTIHIKNSGVSYARNIGIENANGKYISFIDADDYIEPDFYEYLFSIIEKYSVDISYCGYRKIDVANNELVTPKKNNKVEIFTPLDACACVLAAKCGFSEYIWNGLYDKNLISTFLVNQAVGEDQIFTIETVLKAKKIGKGYDIKYNYRINYAGSRSINIMKRIEFQYSVFNAIKGVLDSYRVPQDIYKAFHLRRMRMELGLMDLYSNSQVHNEKVFSLLQRDLKNDTILSYDGILGKILAFIFSANEKAYRTFFHFKRKFAKY